MEKLLLIVCIIISSLSILFNILLWIRVKAVSKKRKELSRYVDKIVKDVTKYFNEHHDRISTLEYKAKQANYVPQQVIHISEKQPIQQEAQEAKPKIINDGGSHNDFSKKHKKLGKKHSAKESPTTQHPVVTKTVYLRMNSENYFLEDNFEEQKSETSKFVAELTSESKGTFYPIDVERIRGTNISNTVKQFGLVSIKDAQSFNVIDPGKIIKESEGVWKIESPVTVKFIK